MKDYITLSITLLVFLCLSSFTHAKKRQPNIIFIITDDQKLQEFNYIKGRALTPHVDTLANQGIRFDRAYVSSSVCSPSRYTCLSGHYASRCSIPFFKEQSTAEGVTRVLWNTGFDTDQITLPMALQKNGYTTGFIGKWHINGLYAGRSIPKGTSPSDPIVNEILAENQKHFRSELKHFGFDFADRVLRGNPNDDKVLVNCGMNIHNQEWLTQGALSFIEQNKDNPFFLYFSTTLTHVPDGYDSLVGDPRKSPGGYLDETIDNVQPSRQDVIERCKAAGLPKELWASAWLDDGVGALMSKVDDLGLSKDTLFVYFVDHGMNSGSKGTCYEGGLISPTLAYWPGTIKPSISKELIQNIDFAPTFLDLAGAAAPENMKLDGKSFAPLLRGEDFKGHESVYSEIGLTRAVTTKNWKYIAFKVPNSLNRTLEERMTEQMQMIAATEERLGYKLEVDPLARYYQMGMSAGGSSFERGQIKRPTPWKKNYFDSDQLYHLAEDPDESENLADNPQHAKKLEEMKALLVNYLNRLPGTYPELKPSE